MARDIAKSVARNGAKHIVLMIAHAGHLAQLADVCYGLNVCNEFGGTVFHNISPYNSVAIETLAQLLEEEIFLHAEELETSIMLLWPDLVSMKRQQKRCPLLFQKV